MRLDDLVVDPDSTLDDIAAFLDNLDGTQRWEHVQRLGRDEQRTLYRKSASSTIGLNHFVRVADPLVEVIHDGINTLPVMPRLRRFQKRFCRPDDSSSQRLFGYNEGPLRRLIGPGYFVAFSTEADLARQAHGGVVVDYFQVPGGAVATGWPQVVPNARGLQRYVYDQTRDFMRRVSAHVCVGAAFKRDKPLDHYFVLCRRE
jgi:hypothetical protein